MNLFSMFELSGWRWARGMRAEVVAANMATRKRAHARGRSVPAADGGISVAVAAAFFAGPELFDAENAAAWRSRGGRRSASVRSCASNPDIPMPTNKATSLIRRSIPSKR